VVNPHASRALEAEIVVRGASIASGSGQVLTNTDLHAHNDFQNPDAVHPDEVNVKLDGSRVIHRFPPASVTALYLTLA
jgi:alpha-N-arabinofuranosidase